MVLNESQKLKLIREAILAGVTRADLYAVLDSMRDEMQNTMPALSPAEGAVANAGLKIDAIKMYRDRTKCGLKDAKDAVYLALDPNYKPY